MITDDQRAHYRRSVERAKTALTPGDRVRLLICGGGEATYTFECWDGDQGCFQSRSGISDLHPYNVVRVNGAPTSFRDA